MIGMANDGDVDGGDLEPPPDASTESSEEEIADRIVAADEIAFLPDVGVQPAVPNGFETGLAEEGVLGPAAVLLISCVETTIDILWKTIAPATQRVIQDVLINYHEIEMSGLDTLREKQLWGPNHPTDLPIASLASTTSTTNDERISPQFWAAFCGNGNRAVIGMKRCHLESTHPNQ